MSEDMLFYGKSYTTGKKNYTASIDKSQNLQ